MNSYGVTEYELVSGCVSEIRKTIAVKEKDAAVDEMKSEVDRIRKALIKSFGIRTENKQLMARMYYTVAYSDKRPLLSFPWMVVADILLKLKKCVSK